LRSNAVVVRPRAGSQSVESSVTCGVDAETALSEALAEVGPTIFAAAFCEVVAFSVGITMNIPALTQFCAVAAIAVAIDFNLQIVWFVPATLLDAWRQELRRVDITPCITLRGPGEPHTRCSPCCPRDPEGEEEEVVDALGYGPSGMGMDVGLERGYARFGPWQDAARVAMEAAYKREAEAAGRFARQEQGRLAEPLLFAAAQGAGGGEEEATLSVRLVPAAAGSQRAPPSPSRLLRPPSLPSLQMSPTSTMTLPPFGSSPRFRDDSPDPDKHALLEAYGRGGDEPGGPPPQKKDRSSTGGSLELDAGGEGGAHFGGPRTTPPATPSRASATSPSRWALAAPRPISLKPTGCLCLSPYFWGIVNRGNFVRRFMSHFYIPFLLQPAVRVAVLVLWVVLVVVGVVSLGNLQLGLEQQLILPTGSYLAPYFKDLAHLGDAGPPAYLVLQNINYTHPQAFSAISNFAQGLGALNDVLVPPVYSWVGDYSLWLARDLSTLGADCPSDPDSSPTLASSVSFFLYNFPITGKCCQAHGYCGGQYTTDIQFLWGVPKSSSSTTSSFSNEYARTEESVYISLDGELSPAVVGGVTKVGKDVRIAPVGISSAGSGARMPASRTLVQPTLPGALGSSSRVVDDGGCDFSLGYVAHSAVEAAAAHSGVALSHRLRVPSTSAAAAGGFPPALLAALASDPGAALMPCHIMISRLRAQHRPVRNQSNFISYKQVMQTAVEQLQGSLPTISDFGLLGIEPGSPAAPPPWPPSPGAPGNFTDNQHTAWLPSAPGGAAFPYSLIYVYYEQYSYIRGVAAANLIIAVLSVFMACLIVANLSVALVVLVLISSLTLSVVGWTWALNPHGVSDPYGDGPYGVDVNAVYVVNLITATGLGVEFLIHITSAYLENIRTERERQASKMDAGARARDLAEHEAAEGEAGNTFLGRLVARWKRIRWLSPAERNTQVHGALVEMGSSVVTGITFTKLVGVLILARAPSQLFRLYYFRESPSLLFSSPPPPLSSAQPALTSPTPPHPIFL
jgi:hypothetical protein